MRKGRENKAPPADLLVCFPSRAHLALMPKPVSSPIRPNLKKIKSRGGPDRPSDLSEPTSPKVTCAGQIKARPRLSAEYGGGGGGSNCKNLQSVMKEIERIQNTRSKHNRKSKHWAEALGFKKDVMNFLTCLGNIRFDFRCFGSFPGQVDVSSDDDEEEEDAEEEEEEETEDEENNAVFSKWYMVLQEENQNPNNNIDQTNDSKTPEVPPPNALLLMRCRSAPAKRGSWLKERDFDFSREKEMAEEKKEREEEEEEEKRKRESLEIVMKYDTDFYNLSTDVSQETWVVGDTFSRSRSWRR